MTRANIAAMKRYRISNNQGSRDKTLPHVCANCTYLHLRTATSLLSSTTHIALTQGVTLTNPTLQRRERFLGSLFPRGTNCFESFRHAVPRTNAVPDVLQFSPFFYNEMRPAKFPNCSRKSCNHKLQIKKSE